MKEYKLYERPNGFRLDKVLPVFRKRVELLSVFDLEAYAFDCIEYNLRIQARYVEGMWCYGFQPLRLDVPAFISSCDSGGRFYFHSFEDSEGRGLAMYTNDHALLSYWDSFGRKSINS